MAAFNLSTLLTIIEKISGIVTVIFNYLTKKTELKAQVLELEEAAKKEKQEKIVEKNERIDEICDNGDLKDILEEMENK